MFWLRTSRSMRSAWLRSLLEYAATMNNWPRRCSGVSELNTLSTQAASAGEAGMGSAGSFFTSENDKSKPAASSKAARPNWKGMRISPVGRVGWFKGQTGREGRTFVVGNSGTRRLGLEVPNQAGGGGK
jgi:hypothetical protein